jgi:sugar/nucleoside kinase (ribokinase family)
MPQKPKILCVGNQCIDIICVVNAYPSEDSQIKASEQFISRGGNGGNTTVVLSQLGDYDIQLMCSLGSANNSYELIVSDLGWFVSSMVL